MISAIQAFESAHAALAGSPFHEAAGDLVISRDNNRYTVLVAAAGTGHTPADDTSARVIVDAESGAVLQSRKPADTAFVAAAGARISVGRALEIGLKRLEESTLAYDPYWTTSVLLKGGSYVVTFPVPAHLREFSEGPDYAIQVTIDARSGVIVGALSGG